MACWHMLGVLSLLQCCAVSHDVMVSNSVHNMACWHMLGVLSLPQCCAVSYDGE